MLAFVDVCAMIEYLASAEYARMYAKVEHALEHAFELVEYGVKNEE